MGRLGRREGNPVTFGWRRIAAAVLLGVLLLGFAVWQVLQPDRDACKAAVNAEVTMALASDQTIEQWGKAHDADIKRRLRWPCRFQSEYKVKLIYAEVINLHMFDMFGKSFGEAAKP